MNQQSHDSKAEKKLAKAMAKSEKKAVKAEKAAAVAAQQAAQGEQDSSETKARATLAAERQVRLQRYRVWIALATALIAMGTLLASVLL